ncbi:MAG: insulinase family protein [Ignavibacteriae bacterium]|nr:insulinase family protein [Ignavibacteria bacterium]MBI3364082.1 insulinase family protein [Ignavibacteriota bacterium]
MSFLLTSSVSFAQKADRSKPPELGPAPSLQLPPIQHLKLSNGLAIVLLEKHNLPLCQAELIVRGGIAADPIEKTGLASMTADMMEQGAGSRNALELADAIDFLGASISAFAGWHTSGVILHTPVSKLDSALALFGDVALRPIFPADELERQRKERLTTLIQWHDRPGSIASVAFNKTLFGDKHPYGVPTIGNEKSIRSFMVEDLRDFHSRYFHPNNATLVVVGDVSAQTLLPKLEAAFGEWKPADAPKPSWPTAEQVKERKIYLVDKPGAAQSEIRIGRIGVGRMTEDYYALEVMNTILGGSFTSRLNQNLREQHGYAYGAGSNFDYRVLPGPFAAGAAVQTNVTDKALSEFMKELNGILAPVSDEELTRAKNYLTLGYPASFESVAQIADRLTEIIVYNLPNDYFNNYTKNILSVTKEDVERVAKKYLEPEKVAIIVVGDKKEIEKGITDLKLAPIQPLTIDEVLGPAPVVTER